MVQNEISQGQVLAPLSAGRLDTLKFNTFSRGWMVDFDGFFFQKQLNPIHIMGLSQSKGGRLRAGFWRRLGKTRGNQGRFQRSFGERTVPDEVAGRFLKVLDLGCI